MASITPQSIQALYDEYGLWYDRIGENEFIVLVFHGSSVIANFDTWEEGEAFITGIVRESIANVQLDRGE